MYSLTLTVNSQINVGLTTGQTIDDSV